MTVRQSVGCEAQQANHAAFKNTAPLRIDVVLGQMTKRPPYRPEENRHNHNTHYSEVKGDG